MKERKAFSLNGISMVVVLLLLLVFGIFTMVGGFDRDWGQFFFGILVIVLGLVATAGFSMVGPNHSKVVTFLGKYMGTIRETVFAGPTHSP